MPEYSIGLMRKVVGRDEQRRVWVDAEDLHFMLDYHWMVYRTLTPSVQARVWSRNKQRSVLLARFVMSAPGGLEVDHLNGDPLDNRKSNLRVCTHGENMQNRHIFGDDRGVSWSAQRRKWVAQAGLNKNTGGPFLMKRFDSKEEALAAVRKWREENVPFFQEKPS